jgi:hypothetical protein
METARMFQIPRLSDISSAQRRGTFRLTNRHQHGIIVKLTITRGRFRARKRARTYSRSRIFRACTK